MAWIEVSYWTANEAEDLSHPQAWTIVRRSPKFPDVALAKVGTILTEPSVRASAIDVAPESIVGLLYGQEELTAFCFQAVNYAQVSLWLACARAGTVKDYDFVCLWSLAVSSGQVDQFKWTTSVDTSALRKMPGGGAVSSHPRVAPAERHVALRHGDSQRRLRACCEIAGQFQARRESPPYADLALVDNLTLVTGNKIHIAGLAPSFRFCGRNWRIIDLAAPDKPDEALFRYRQRIAAIGLKSKSGDGNPGERLPLTSEVDVSEATPSTAGLRQRENDNASMRPLGLSDIQLLRNAINTAVDGAIRAGETTSGTAIEHDLLVAPERLGADVRQAVVATELSSSAFGVLARAQIIARFPAAALEAHEAFAKWIKDTSALDLQVHACAAADASQAAYDYCRLQANPSDFDFAVTRLDHLLDSLTEKIDRLAMPDTGDNILMAVRSEIGPWAIVEAMDRLAELESTSPQRDRQVSRAQAIIRLLVRQPTPDIVIRSVQAALVADDRSLSGLISRQHHGSALVEIGAIAVADILDLPVDEARKIFLKEFHITTDASKDRREAHANDQDPGAPIENSSSRTLFDSFV